MVAKQRLDYPSLPNLLEVLQPTGVTDPHGNCGAPLPPLGLGKRQIAVEMRRISGCLPPDGMAWVFPSPVGRLSLAGIAARNGLEVKAAYAQLVDSSGPKIVIPLDLLCRPSVPGLTGRHNRLRQFAAGCMRVRGAARIFEAVYPSIAYAIGRPRSPRPAEWLLRAAGIKSETGAVLLRRSWHARDSATAYIFQEPGGLFAVAKIPGSQQSLARIERERSLLCQVAQSAGLAGIEVPRVLSITGSLRPALLVGAIQGNLAASILNRRAAELGPLVDKLSSWLSGWNSSTIVEPVPGMLSRRLFDLAGTLEPHIPNGREYFSHLHRLLASESQALPTVACHGDLTMWNVLITHSGLGILDWEEAEPTGVPLTDLFYLVLDAASACDSYRDRPAAFRSCFSGSQTRWAARAIRRCAHALRLSRAGVEICFHLCWLRHAANELHRGRPGPFLNIVRLCSQNAGRAAQWTALG